VRGFVAGRPQVSVDVKATKADPTIEIPLQPGSNGVTLVAFDDAGRASNPINFEIAAPASNSGRPDVWVIAAGVGWYPNLAPEDQLEGSVNDAYAIAGAFTSQAGAANTLGCTPRALRRLSDCCRRALI